MELGRIRKGADKTWPRQLHKRMNWRTVWQVMEQFVMGRMSVGKAGEWLGVKRSRVYELRRRFIAIWETRQRPTPGWLYARPDTWGSRLPSEVQGFLEEELRYWRQESPYFRGHLNFAFIAQECEKRFGKRFHRNTLRRWAAARGLFDPATDKTGKAFVRFEMGGVGMLYQHDSSLHAWVPGTKRNDVLILTIDDHSRKVVGAMLVPQDSAWYHLCLVRETIEAYGVPLAYYTDNARIFNSQTDLHTQFGRALKTLDITLKLTAKAHPQAKGKVEKRFDYFQRRIPLLCEKYRITNLTKATRVLQDEVQFYNERHVHDETQETPAKRWQKAVMEGRCHLQTLNVPADKLDWIFGLHYPRVVRLDRTVEFAHRLWPVPHGPVGQTVTVVLRPAAPRREPHAQIYVVFQDKVLVHHILTRRFVADLP